MISREHWVHKTMNGLYSFINVVLPSLQVYQKYFPFSRPSKYDGNSPSSWLNVVQGRYERETVEWVIDNKM